MELDFKKKIIIGAFIVVVLAISGYLYYDYTNNNNTDNINIEDDINEVQSNIGGEIENKLLENSSASNEDIIIVHVSGAVNNPRNCKNKGRSKTL